MTRQGTPPRKQLEMTYHQVPAKLRQLFSGSRRPTALLTTSTRALPDIFTVLDEFGLVVPRDVSLLTVDSAPDAWPALTGRTRPVSCHYLQWDSIIKTAMEEVLAVIRGARPVRHIELPVPFRDEGTLADAPR